MTSISPTINRSFTGNLEIDEQPVPATVQFTDEEVSLVVGGDIVGTWASDEVEFAGVGQGYELRAEGDAIKFLPEGPEEFGAFVSGRATETAPDPSPSGGGTPDPSPAATSPEAETEIADPGHLEEPGEPEDRKVTTDLDVGSQLEPSLPFDDDEGATPDFSLPFEDGEDGTPDFRLPFEDSEEEGTSDLRPSFGQDEDGSVSDLAPSFDNEEPRKSGITWETNPDEGFAAGINGASTDAAPSPFRSAFTAPTEPPTDAATATWEIPARTTEPAPADSPAHESPSRPEPEDCGEIVDAPEDQERTRVWESIDHSWDASVEPPPPTWKVPAALPTAPTEESPAEEHAPADEIPSIREDPELVREMPAVEEEPSAPAEPEDEPGSDGPSTAARAVAVARGLIAGLRERRQTPETERSDETPIGAAADDDTPQPIEDGENLRQWGLVVAGGAVLLVLVGIVTWGLASMLGGDEPLEVDLETPSTVATAGAPAPTVEATTTVAPTTTTTLAPPTTVSPENEAAATEFVRTWNTFATKYAYHLSISADSLPISVAPAPTVHLTYDEAGILRLNMVPKGTGSDRDILLAMGLAVAWGDPTLSPEGRKEVLGAMGVDVDNPQLGEMGGTLTRNGVSYDARVVDGLIQFEVAPSA